MRLLVQAAALLALLPTLITFSAGLTARTTLVDPGYCLDVVRSEDVIPRVKNDFLDGLVGNMNLPASERTALRAALDEGVRVDWLEEQLQRTLEGLSFYLTSDVEGLSIRLPVVELKIFVLSAVRRHMGDATYLSMAAGLEDIPDFLDIGPGLDLAPLRQIRPYWRATVLSPMVAGLAALALTALVWLVTGRRVGGLGLAGGVWTAAGLAVVGAALSLVPFTGELLPVLLPLTVPELGSLSLHSVLLAAAGGVQNQLLAVGAGVTVAGVFLMAAPRTVWERKRWRPRGREHTLEGN